MLRLRLASRCFFVALVLCWAFAISGSMGRTPSRRRSLMPTPIPRSSPQRCEVTGCGQRGTCNSAEGVCRCQYGFRGPTCGEYMLRSCYFGPTDYEGWSPPAVPPGLESVMYLMGPVSCMCLAELLKANGHRGMREILPETECFVRVPQHHVTVAQLTAMQHSGWGGDNDARTSLHFRGFRTFDFLAACSSAMANAAKPSPPECHTLTQAYTREFHRGPIDEWHRLPEWVPDRDCVKHSAGCKWTEREWKYAHANESCCYAGGSRCKNFNVEAQRPMTCACARGYDGQRCEQPCRFGCINACSGHGECLAGWCRCYKGWFGIDCSLPADASRYPEPRPVGSPLPPSPPPPKHVSELKIYVYDVPPSVLQAEPCMGCTDLCGGLYNSNNFFLGMLLRDPGHLTTDPDAAHLFYAPLLPYRYSHNLGRSSPHIRDTVDAIKSMGYFDRNGGKDHIWYVVGDIQTCQVTHVVRPGIILGHWGRLDVWGAGYDPNHAPCMDPRKDLVVPALSVPGAALLQRNGPGSPSAASYLQPQVVLQAKLAFADGWMDQPRPILLFFSGSNVALGDPRCADPDNNAFNCRDAEYAMGIRAAFFKWFRENEGNAPDVELHDTSVGSEYYPKLRSSRFCMDTAGHGFSVRILDYMASGCIPVIIRDDILWPYESYELGGDGTENWQQDSAQGRWDDLPRVHYPEFSISIRKKGIPALLSMLRGISSDRLRQLQEGVQRVHKAFLWDEEYGLAYNYTLTVLARLRANIN
eukprot:jgi/Mesvir1/25940/Mv20934-RA.1